MIDQVEEVKSKVDIVEVISSYIPLKKMGRNFGGLCPFHGEKTPSFMVSPERQSFKCFGCGEGGDVFTLLEKLEGWDFKETLEELAKRAGVKLKAVGSSRNTKLKEKLIDIHKLAAKFYNHILETHPAGEIARNYLKGRGVGDSLWSVFGLGYAPEAWENLYGFLVKRGFDAADVALSGLVIGREGAKVGKSGFYDRFRGRIMFPIKDNRGTILGFSGRVLSKDAKEAKYVNSPETPIFSKGSLLFGLDVAREAIREKNETVLVEGEFDVISAYGAGVKNTVASKGTALTEKQVATIARLSENVALCFDMDLAGDAASRRGIELLDLAGLNIKVVQLKGVKDPDEFAQKDPAGFKKAITGASNVYDYLIESALSRFDAKTGEGKRKIGREILPIISKITDDLMRAHFETKLAKSLELDISLIDEAIGKRREDISLPIEISASQIAESGKGIVLDEYFVSLFLAGEEVFEKALEIVEPEDFEDHEIMQLWKAIGDIIISSKPRKVKDLSSKIPEKFAKLVDHLYFINISPAVLEKERFAQELIEVGARIKKKALSKALRSISTELKNAQSAKDSKNVSKLTREFDKLSQLVKAQEAKI